MSDKNSAVTRSIEPEREIPLGSYLTIGPSLFWLVLAVTISVIAIVAGGNTGHLTAGVIVATSLLVLWFTGTRQPITGSGKPPIARLYDRGYRWLKDPVHKTKMPPATTMPHVRQFGKIELTEHELPGQPPLGVIWDKREKTMAATIVVPHAPLYVMDGSAQDAALDTLAAALDRSALGKAVDLLCWSTMRLVGEPVAPEEMLRELRSASHTTTSQPMPGVYVLNEIMQQLGSNAGSTLSTYTVSVHVPTALREARRTGANTAKVVLMRELSLFGESLIKGSKTGASDLPPPHAMSVPELTLFNGLCLDPVTIKPWWDRWLIEPENVEVAPVLAMPSFIDQRHTSYVQSGSTHFRTFCVAGTGGLKPTQFTALHELPISMKITTILEPIPKSRARWRAERMTHAHGSITLDQSTKGQTVTQHALSMERQAATAEAELAEGSAQEFRTQVYVSVWGRTPEEALLNAAFVAQKATSVDVVLVPLEGQHLQGLTYSAPWNRWNGRASRAVSWWK